MPCSDGHPFDRSDNGYREGLVRKSLDERTDMLCRVLSIFPENIFILLPADIREWYAKHQEFDKSQGR